ncbi:putative ubiquitin protein ligase, partial [Geranomyces variabilis]
MATSRSAAVKRLMKELAELRNDPSPEFTAAPLEENLLEWHFTLRGPPEGGFEGGRFHGRLIFPPEYPFKPPNISFLTPNGRFEVGKKICLSITDHHPEYWRPAWGVRTALVALISFLPTPGDGAIGALDHTPEERRAQALLSRTWVCPTCGSENATALPDETERPSERLLGDPEISFT